MIGLFFPDRFTQGDLYARGYRSRGVPRKRGRRDQDEDVGTAGNASAQMNSAQTTSNGRSGPRGGGRPRPSVAGTGSAAGGGRLGGSGALDGDRASQSWSGTVEVRLAFTGRRFLRLRLDNYPQDKSERRPAAAKPEVVAAENVSAKNTLAATTEESERPTAADASAGSEKKSAKVLEVKEKALVVRTEASGAGTVSAISDADSAAVTTLEREVVGPPSANPAEQKASSATVVSSASAPENSASGVPRVWMKNFTPTPLAGPRPALARGGWASLAASTATSTGVSEAGGGGDEGGQLGLAGAWVNRPLSVLYSLRSLLLSRSPGPKKASDGDGGSEDSALVCLLRDGVRETQPSGEDCDCDYGSGLRRDPLEQLAGKMRLLLQADLADGNEDENDKVVGSGRVAVSQVKLGLGEFISLLEDVHRSVERTTRQRCVNCYSCMER